jgi:hypothetical protein
MTDVSSGPGVSTPATAPPPTGIAEVGKPKQPKKRLTLWPEVREHQIAMLEAVYEKPFEEAEQAWSRVLQEMRLELWHYIAARLVIDSVAWRDKACPYGYVATITRRKAKRLRLGDSELAGEQLPRIGDRTTEETIDYIEQELSKCKGGIWKARQPQDDPYDPGPIGSVGLHWLRPDGDAGYDVDWGAAAQAAGLDEIEQEILESRSLGLSRSALLEECQTERERLEYQAAWKRLSRKMGRVREVLRNERNLLRDVPDLEIEGSM